MIRAILLVLLVLLPLFFTNCVPKSDIQNGELATILHLCQEELINHGSLSEGLLKIGYQPLSAKCMDRFYEKGNIKLSISPDPLWLNAFDKAQGFNHHCNVLKIVIRQNTKELLRSNLVLVNGQLVKYPENSP